MRRRFPGRVFESCGQRLHYSRVGRLGATILAGLTMVGNASAGKVLIIDDDDDIAQVVRTLLTDEGFVVATLKDGTEEQSASRWTGSSRIASSSMARHQECTGAPGLTRPG